ncbi:MAG: hypothetical protein PHF51_04435 [Candidatus ainarchaeum sp.]|nr:hypothetical protein [Candidatus ainarchaeum sp.]
MPSKKKGSRKSMAPVSGDRKLGRALGVHALDRLSFWAGAGMMILSGVLLLHGIDALTAMTTGLGGSLALILE